MNDAILPPHNGWKFAGRSIVIERRALPAGDYTAIVGDDVIAVVERKTLENLATSLSDGGLAFQMQRLAEVAKAAIVVEGDYPDLFRTQHGRGSWLADMLGRLAVRYPEPFIAAAVHLVESGAEEGLDNFLAISKIQWRLNLRIDRTQGALRRPLFRSG